MFICANACIVCNVSDYDDLSFFTLTLTARLHHKKEHQLPATGSFAMFSYDERGFFLSVPRRIVGTSKSFRCTNESLFHYTLVNSSIFLHAHLYIQSDEYNLSSPYFYICKQITKNHLYAPQIHKVLHFLLHL